MAKAIKKVVLPDDLQAKCAACRSEAYGGPRARRTAEGFVLMLCDNVATCCARFRGGNTPAQYAALVRTGEKP